MREPRSLPANVDAEASVLGAVLMHAPSFDKLADLEPEDFFDPRHVHVFTAMRAMEAAGKPIDVLTLEEQLRVDERFPQIGGASFLGELVARVATTANTEYYAEMVRAKACARRVMLASAEVYERGYISDGREADYADEAQQRIFDAAEMGREAKLKTAKQVMKETIAGLSRRMDPDSGPIGVRTGFKEVDELILGLRPTDLFLVAGRPAMGKTQFALDLLRYACLEDRFPTIVFSLEMGDTQLGDRMLAGEANVAGDLIRRGRLTRDELMRIQSAASRIAASPLLMADLEAPTLQAIRSRARRWRADKTVWESKDKDGKKREFGLVVIDYIQLMHGPDDSGRVSREQEISAISRGLKAMAKMLECPVVAISQLSRKPDERQDKRPMLSDLRESGSLEQDADGVIFMYRDDYYDKESKDKGIAEALIAKQRNGATGTAHLRWNSSLPRFENLSRRGDEY